MKHRSVRKRVKYGRKKYTQNRKVGAGFLNNVKGFFTKAAAPTPAPPAAPPAVAAAPPVAAATAAAPKTIVSAVKAAANVALRQDSGVRLKYLFSLLNPANADRMICKNEFFVEFLDMATVKPLFPFVNQIKSVLDGDRVYLFSDKAVPPSFQLPSKKSEGVAVDESKLKQPPAEEDLLIELPDEGDEKDEKDDASDIEDNSVAEAGIQAEEDETNKVMKRVYPASTANKYVLTTLTALSGGLITNLENADVYKSRLTFADINDNPLVEKSTWANGGIGKKKKWLKFDDKYDVFFRFLHYFKYQLNRTLWDPVEVVTHSRMRYLFKSMIEMINSNAELKNDYKSNVYYSFPRMKMSDKALQINPLMKQQIIPQTHAPKIVTSPDEEQPNSYTGQSIVRLAGKIKDSGMILSWKLISKLKKYYDFDSPLNLRPPNIKYLVLDKKFPKYMENEVKFAMFTLLAFLKGKANNVDIIEAANSTFATNSLRRINLEKLQNALGLKSNFGGMGVESNGDLSRLEISIDTSFASYINAVLSNKSKIARMIRDEYYKGIKDLVNVVPQLMIQDIQNKGTELIREWVKDKPDKKYEYEAQQFYRNGMGQIRKIFKDYKNSVVASRYSCDGNCQSNNNTIRKIRYELFGVADIGITPQTINERINKIETPKYHEKIFHNLKCAFVESIAYLYLYYFPSIQLKTDDATINLNDIQISGIPDTLIMKKDTGLLYNRVKFTYNSTNEWVNTVFGDSAANNDAFKKAYVDNFYKSYNVLLEKNKIEIDTTQPVTLKYGPKQVSNGNTIYYGNDLEQFPIAWFKNLTIRQMVTLLEDAASDRKTEADKTFSNATAPNATAPNATAPNATAPNATAPAAAPAADTNKTSGLSKLKLWGGNENRRTRRRRPHTHRANKPNRKHRSRVTREKSHKKTRKYKAGALFVAGNMPNISRAMDYVFDSCNCWMVKRMMNSFNEQATSHEMIGMMSRFFLMIRHCTFNSFNVLFWTAGTFIINESIPGLHAARLAATTALTPFPLIRSAVEIAMTVPTVQCAVSMALIAELIYYTQTGLGNVTTDKNELQLELDILSPPFIDWVKDTTGNWIQLSYALKDIPNVFKNGWYYVDGTNAANVAYIKSIQKQSTGEIYEIQMFYYIAFEIEKLKKTDAKPTFKTELFHQSVIIKALTKIKAPDINNPNNIINDNSVIGNEKSPETTPENNQTNNRFVWMNGMFLGYMRQFENKPTHSFPTYRFIEANEGFTEGNLVSEVRNPKLWFLKSYTNKNANSPTSNIKTKIEDIKKMYEDDKSNLYFTYYPDDNSLTSAIDNTKY